MAQRRYMLLEKVTVLAQHNEGGPPRWRVTAPLEQLGIGVYTWRALNGAWVETFWHRRSEETFPAYRVRMLDPDNQWPGFPTSVELYDIVGETERENVDVNVEDISQMLLNQARKAQKGK